MTIRQIYRKMNRSKDPQVDRKKLDLASVNSMMNRQLNIDRQLDEYIDG